MNLKFGLAARSVPFTFEPNLSVGRVLRIGERFHSKDFEPIDREEF
jgi:hypothetical protein